MFRKALALLLAGLWAAAATADAPADTGGPEASREAVIARSAEVAAEIQALQADPSPAAAARRRRLERLERMLQRHQEQLRRGDELAAQRADLEAVSRRNVAEIVEGEPPFRVADYDAALAAQTEAEQMLEALEAAAQDASNSLEEARRLFEKRSGFQEEAAVSPPADGEPAAPEGPAAQAERRATAALLLEIAERNLDQRRQKLANAREAVALQQQLIAERRRQADWIAARVAATENELEGALAALDAEEVALEGRRQRAEIELGVAQRRWEALGRRTADVEEIGSAQRAETAALRAELAARQKEIALLGERLDRVERAREALERRFAVLGGRASRDDVRSWLAESQQAAASLERELRLSRAELEGLVQELASLEADLPSDEEAPWRRRQLQALRGAVAVTQEAIESQDDELLREQRLALAAERTLGGRSLAARLRELQDVAGDAWSYELTRSEDRSITVGRIASAILTFLIGVALARLLTQVVGARVLKRFGVDEGASAAYQSLFYYGCVAFAFLLALRAVDIPLTVFAVLGGALAIGVGFGSQNIVNNFISGLILLAERPIKKGDIVQVEDTYGNVESIGLRSTRIRTGGNIHVIVPNSAFLEHNVINWTHTDPEVGVSISVGVAYGSPTREVERQLLRALAEHPRVLATPEPNVQFTAFGADALHFEAGFRVRIRSMGERAQIESDLRFRIDELFREAGLVMAFPQRDIHLDAATPIPVRLVDAGETGVRR
jgi:small-conductance mechanosensitive channel